MTANMTLRDIEEAQRRIAGHVVRTPMRPPHRFPGVQRAHIPQTGKPSDDRQFQAAGCHQRYPAPE
jgi:hypothetical protein